MKKSNTKARLIIIIVGIVVFLLICSGIYAKIRGQMFGAPTKIDVSSQTNLAVTSPVVLTNDTLSLNLYSTALEIDSTASISGAINLGNLISCDTIDSNANGLLSCGTDATGAGGEVHGLLNSDYFNDVLTASVSQGSLIIGNATPKWSSLGIGASNSFFLSDGTTGGWDDSSNFLALTHASISDDLTIGSNITFSDLIASISSTLYVGDTLTVASGSNIDSGTLYVDAAADYVGIGTTSPGYKLDVAGDINFGGNKLVGNTDAVHYYIQDNGSGLLNFKWWSGIQFSTNTGDVLKIQSDGNVGIGTTAPGAKLDVITTSGYSAQFTNPAGYQARFYDYGTEGVTLYMNAKSSQWFTLSSGEWMTRFQSSRALGFSTSANYIQFVTVSGGLRLTQGGGLSLGTSYAVDGIEPGAGNMIIQGNVGIGDTSPTYKLSVDGTASISGKLTLDDALDVAYGGTNLTTIGASEILYGSSAGVFGAIASGTENYVLTMASGVPAWAAATGGGTPGGSDTQIQFNDGGVFGGNAGLIFNKAAQTIQMTHASVSDDLQIGTITQAQVNNDFYWPKVVIGNDTNEFEIGLFASGSQAGVMGISDIGYGVEGYSISDVGVHGGSTDGIGVHGYSNSYRGVYGESYSDVGVYGKSDSYVGVYGWSGSSSGVYGESYSDVGVYGWSGTSSGVYGESYSYVGVYGESGSSYGVYGLTDTGDYAIYADGGLFAIHASISDDLTQGTALGCATGVITNAIGTFTGCVGSDKSLKKNIQTADYSALSIIAQLKPVNYKWQDANQRDNLTHTGFLAQDVEKIFPNAVVSAGVNLKGIDPLAMVSLLAKGINEQQAQIDALKKLGNFGSINEKGECEIPKELTVDKLTTKQICFEGDCVDSHLWKLLIKFLKILDKIF